MRQLAFALLLNVAMAQVPVVVTYYHPVPWQTDSRPWEASCGRLSDAPGQVVALSRDLFFREDGSKRCGEKVFIRLESGEVIFGVVWDTMNARFKRRVDVLYPPGNRPTWGKTKGLLFWEDENTG